MKGNYYYYLKFFMHGNLSTYLDKDKKKHNIINWIRKKVAF